MFEIRKKRVNKAYETHWRVPWTGSDRLWLQKLYRPHLLGAGENPSRGHMQTGQREEVPAVCLSVSVTGVTCLHARGNACFLCTHIAVIALSTPLASWTICIFRVITA